MLPYRESDRNCRSRKNVCDGGGGMCLCNTERKQCRTKFFRTSEIVAQPSGFCYHWSRWNYRAFEKQQCTEIVNAIINLSSRDIQMNGTHKLSPWFLSLSLFLTSAWIWKEVMYLLCAFIVICSNSVYLTGWLKVSFHVPRRLTHVGCWGHTLWIKRSEIGFCSTPPLPHPTTTILDLLCAVTVGSLS